MSEYKFFRDLSKEEEKTFRQWARDNYKIGDTITTSWHPVVIDECMSMLIEQIKEEPDVLFRKEQP